MIAGSMVAILYKVIFGSWDWIDGTIVIAFFVMRGIIEWGIHSWLYHANPLPLVHWRLASVISDMHYKHHVDPLDLSTLLITWKGVTAVLTVTLMTSSLLLVSVNRGMSMMLGFAIVAFMIEFLHLICHCRIPHRSLVIKRLVLLHRSHHYKHHERNYGVSSSLGDRLFNTYEPVIASNFSTESLGKDVGQQKNNIRADAARSFSQVVKPGRYN